MQETTGTSGSSTAVATASPPRAGDFKVSEPERTLRDRMAFEQFLADLAAEFVNVSGDRVDAAIRDGLRRLVEFLDADGGSLARIAADGGGVVLSAYAVPGAPALPPPGPIGTGPPWYAGELVHGRAVRVCQVDDLPPAAAAAERAFCAALGLTAYMSVPVSVNGMPNAVLFMASARRDHRFPSDVIPRLRLIGEVFANALVRRDADHRYHRLQGELSHVTRVLTMGQLAASIAHELNQPLCAITNNAHAAIRQLGRPQPDLADVRGALDDIAADGKRAGEIVTRSHGLMKRRELVLEPVSVNDVVRDVAALLHGESVIRRVALGLDLDESVPRVCGDRVQLQQVVLNLVVNAMDATADLPEGARRVDVSTARTGRNVQVVVRDTGVGLTPDVAARMFDPFFTTKPNGLGMGLAIAQAIVESHGGELHACSRDEPGATVDFWLPGLTGETA